MPPASRLLQGRKLQLWGLSPHPRHGSWGSGRSGLVAFRKFCNVNSHHELLPILIVTLIEVPPPAPASWYKPLQAHADQVSKSRSNGAQSKVCSQVFPILQPGLLTLQDTPSQIPVKCGCWVWLVLGTPQNLQSALCAYLVSCQPSETCCLQTGNSESREVLAHHPRLWLTGHAGTQGRGGKVLPRATPGTCVTQSKRRGAPSG